MKIYICSICGYEYSEAEGAGHIPPNTKWEDVPDDWECPLCGAPKDAFNESTKPEDEKQATKTSQETNHGDKGLSLYEMSALCSNLAKGCEKQQRQEQMELYNQLADYFKNADNFEDDVTLNELREPVQYDLDTYEDAMNTVKIQGDRGALRALVWSEKVTKIVSSILLRYGKQKDALLDGKNVFVCEICGFVYIGNAPPEVCPVCKVPNFKLRKIARR